MTSLDKCYNQNIGIWQEIPGLTGFFASNLGPIRVGTSKILTARYIVGDGLYVPVRESAQSRAPAVWFPVHILVAITFLERPHYSWFEIAGYLNQLVTHKNRDVVDNRVDNLQWVDDPGWLDLDHLMRQPPVPRARAILKDR